MKILAPGKKDVKELFWGDEGAQLSNFETVL